MERLKRTALYGARNLVPCRNELEMIIKQTPLCFQVMFMDGLVVNVNVHPETVAYEMLKQAVKNIALRNMQHFSIYEVSGDLERALRDEENIGDVIAKWEQFQQTVSSKGPQAEYSFMFKKQIHLNAYQDPPDPHSHGDLRITFLFVSKIKNLTQFLW